MKKEIRQISEDGKIVRVTVSDERWYIKTLEDGSLKEYPSSTWIAHHCPMGIGYYRWLAAQGWDNAQKIMEEAGNKGTKIHKGIHSLVLGNEVKMDDLLPNADTGQTEPMTLEEYEAILSFAEWFKEVKPEVLATETVVFNDEYGYAGTLDLICKIGEENWLIDYKSSSDIYASHEAQISSYKKASPIKIDKQGILQVGYRRNKHKKWKFTEIPDQFDLFLAAKRFWEKECEDTKIFVKDYPVSISLS